MSKPITSVAIHQLIERGLLSYETPVAETLGLTPPPGQEPDPWLEQVTVDDLLYHIGGWDQFVAFDPMFHDSEIAAAMGVDLPVSKYDVATYMTGQEMQSEPGTAFVYSNYGYALLGMLIEKVTGCDYTEWVLDNVFRPIGVGRARLGHTSFEELAPMEVRYHGWGGENPYNIAANIEKMDAHGGWVLSAPDYLRFLNAVFDPNDPTPLLSRESIAAMVRTHPETERFAYARGWILEEEDGIVAYGHGGSLPGLSTEGYWRENGFAHVLFVNTRKPIDGIDLAVETLPDLDLFETFGIRREAIGAGNTEVWVPAVAHASGAGGSSWRSDVGLLNRSRLGNRVRLRLHTGGSSPRDHELTLAPGEQRTVEDVMQVLAADGTGSLQVFSSEPLSVASRSFTIAQTGTFGQYLDAMTPGSSLRCGAGGIIMQLREDQVARSNIGLLNSGHRDAEVDVTLFDGQGSLVATVPVTLVPGQLVQLNRPFALSGGRSDITAGYAVLTVKRGEGVIAYGSVLDQGTNDPTTLPVKQGMGSPTQWVAAAAHAAGSAGSVWRSDLGLLNRSGSVVTGQVRLPGDSLAATLTFTLQPGQQRLLEDVVEQLGAIGSGALVVEADGPLLVSSRTYNQSPSGSFGQLLDGVPPERAALRGDTVWLPQLRQDTTFRTNIGVLNTGVENASFTLRLFDAAGTQLGTAVHTIAGERRLQLNEPFAQIAGRNDLVSGYASVTIGEGSGLVAYASVIDNRTNDPTTVAMYR
jgi:hypothetical protein